VTQEIGDGSLIALSEEAMGLALAALDRFGEALPHFRNELAAAPGNAQQAGYARWNAGSQLATLGRYKEAEEEFRQALEIAEKSGAAASLGVGVRVTMGAMALSQRRFAEARKQAEAGIHSSSTAFAVEARMVAARAGGGTSVASEALQLAEKSGDRSLLAPALLAAAEVQWNVGATAAAIEQGTRAQQTLAQLGKPEAEWRAWMLLARAYARAGDRAKARDAAGKASAGLDNLARAWAPADFLSYTARPDIQEHKKQLDQFER
jgi:Flp pilus assembly protein TadD